MKNFNYLLSLMFVATTLAGAGMAQAQFVEEGYLAADVTMSQPARIAEINKAYDTYVAQLKSGAQVNEAEIQALIDESLKIGATEDLLPSIRSDAYLAASALDTLIVNHFRSGTGKVKPGQDSLAHIKLAIQLAPDSPQPLLVYGKGLLFMRQESRINRYFIEHNLDIDLNEEIKNVLNGLSRFELQSRDAELVGKLKKFAR